MCIRDSYKTMPPGCAAMRSCPLEMTSMRLTTAVALLLCVLPFAAPAQVQRSSDYLSKMDSDGDGRVSLLEYQNWLSYAFDGMDRNHDGVLSADEQPGGKGKPITREAYRCLLYTSRCV